MLAMNSVEEFREQLREWREDGGRHSDEVVQFWDEGLETAIDDLGEERWMVLEQVAVAGLDCNRSEVVQECLERLVEQFGPNSLRIKRLIAMKMEMMEKWDDALEVLDAIIEEDEANSSARKRKIAIFKAQGDRSRTVAELNKYLKIFMSDQEAWMELCDLYILDQDYAKAAFCCEEVLLHNPHNHLYHQRQAEIRYTWGGYEQLELAKHYYSQAIKLAPSNMRALYGLLLTTSQLAASQRCPATKRKEFMAVAVWSSKQIAARHPAGGKPGGAANGQMAILKNLMGEMQITD